MAFSMSKDARWAGTEAMPGLTAMAPLLAFLQGPQLLAYNCPSLGEWFGNRLSERPLRRQFSAANQAAPGQSRLGRRLGSAGLQAAALEDNCSAWLGSAEAMARRRGPARPARSLTRWTRPVKATG